MTDVKDDLLIPCVRRRRLYQVTPMRIVSDAMSVVRAAIVTTSKPNRTVSHADKVERLVTLNVRLWAQCQFLSVYDRKKITYCMDKVFPRPGTAVTHPQSQSVST